MADAIQVNVSMEKETAAQLDQMAYQDGYDNRSAFVRLLIRQEYARRFSQPTLMTIGEAQQAAPAATGK